jgi:hypothetical protein
MTKELSEKAKANLQRNAQMRQKDSMFIKLQAGEKKTLQFDAEKMEPKDNKSKDNKSKDNKDNKVTLKYVFDEQTLLQLKSLFKEIDGNQQSSYQKYGI